MIVQNLVANVIPSVCGLGEQGRAVIRHCVQGVGYATQIPGFVRCVGTEHGGGELHGVRRRADHAQGQPGYPDFQGIVDGVQGGIPLQGAFAVIGPHPKRGHVDRCRGWIGGAAESGHDQVVPGGRRIRHGVGVAHEPFVLGAGIGSAQGNLQLGDTIPVQLGDVRKPCQEINEVLVAGDPELQQVHPGIRVGEVRAFVARPIRPDVLSFGKGIAADVPQIDLSGGGKGQPVYWIAVHADRVGRGP